MDKKEIKDWKKFLKSLVIMLETKAQYADALLLHTHDLRILKDKKSVDIGQDTERGIKLRAFDGEKFWEYATTDLDKDRLRKEAERLSSKIEPKNSIKLAVDRKNLDKDFSTKARIPSAKIPIDRKVKFIEKLQKRLLEADRNIINARALYEDSMEFKIFVNRHKQLSQRIEGCLLLAVPYVQTESGEIRYHYESFFKPGYEVTNISDRQIKDITDFALKIRDAKKIRPGKYLCLLTPHLSGLLAHESFGHGMESDTVYKDRARAKEFIGKKIAPSSVSIVDNPAFPARNGSFFFDDEGTIAGPTYLIKNGIVQDPITEMYSASRLGIRRSANARLESFDHKSYARMSNTYFLPGKDKKKDLLRSVKDGLYLHNSSGGMEDPKGWGVQIQGVVAERIRDGKLTGELFYEVGMTGYLPTILSNIKGVGDKLEVPGTGRCGKGHKEWVRVSEGGCYLLIKDIDLS